MRNETVWLFHLGSGNAMPRDRELMPSDFDIPIGNVSLYPVLRGSQRLYFSYDAKISGGYLLSPINGESEPLEHGTTEDQLMHGLTAALPPRVNAITLFNRIMKLPEHLHEPAIDFLSHKRVDTIHDNQADLIIALRGLNKTMGVHTQHDLALPAIIRTIDRAPAETRQKVLKSLRKEYPETWINEARQKITSRPREPMPSAKAILGDFDFRF